MAGEPGRISTLPHVHVSAQQLHVGVGGGVGWGGNAAPQPGGNRFVPVGRAEESTRDERADLTTSGTTGPLISNMILHSKNLLGSAIFCRAAGSEWPVDLRLRPPAGVHIEYKDVHLLDPPTTLAWLPGNRAGEAVGDVSPHRELNKSTLFPSEAGLLLTNAATTAAATIVVVTDITA